MIHVEPLNHEVGWSETSFAQHGISWEWRPELIEQARGNDGVPVVLNVVSSDVSISIDLRPTREPDGGACEYPQLGRFRNYEWRLPFSSTEPTVPEHAVDPNRAGGPPADKLETGRLGEEMGGRTAALLGIHRGLAGAFDGEVSEEGVSADRFDVFRVPQVPESVLHQVGASS